VPEIAPGKLKVCLKLLKDGRLLRQNRKLAYLLRPGEAKAALFARLEQVYVDKQERDRAALEQMVAYAQSGYCRWNVLLDYFGDRADFERCGHCDNCLSPPVAMDAPGRPAELAEPAGLESAAPAAPAPLFAVGSRVKVPKFDVGTVRAVAGDKITIEFPENLTKTFMAEFVESV